MSTGLDCEFVEQQDGWVYILEQPTAPKLTWDWREYADTFGPFATFEIAHDHLRDNHANPGGYAVIPLG